MKFTCDQCDAQYMISDEKVGPGGVKVRCKKCGHVILVRRVPENGAAAPEAAAAPARRPSGGTGEHALDTELGQAFDHAFGGAPSPAPSPVPSPAPDLDATQAVSPDEAARIAERSAAPAEPAPTEWYVAIGQAQVGPLPLAEVRRKWESGDVGPDSLVWRPGMGDWAALTTVSDLAAYLSPVPRGPRPRATTPAPTAATSRATVTPAAAVPAPAPSPDVTWKPAGASALAALASEEIATQAAPAKAEPRPGAAGMASLMDQLPEGGGVDPTGAVPLPIKALEHTGEQKIERRSVVAGKAEQLRHRRSSRTALVAVLVLGLVAAAGVGGWFWSQRTARPAPGPVAVAPPPAPAPAPAPQPEPAPAAAPAAQPAQEGAAAPSAPVTPAAVPAAAPSAPAEAAPATPVVTKAEPPPAEPAPNAAPPGKAAPAHVAKKEARERTAAKHAPAERAPVERAAARAPAAAPPPAAVAEAPKKPAKKGDLLEFESNDPALDEALGSKRSVYVPPAPGGAATTAASVTDSQVNEAVLTRVGALQSCVQEQRARDPNASGVVKMRWSISPDGSAENVKCVSPEYTSSPIAQCLGGVLKATRFPKTAQGRQDVTFPFKF